jgi:hypothetical protein
VYSCEFSSNILGGTTRLVVDLEAATLSSFDEPRLAERCRQTLKELLIRRRNSIIDLITRGPKRIPSSLWQVHKSQRRIVCRHGLERNVGVPLSTVLLLGLCDDRQLSGVFVDFLVQFRIDGADFWVCDTISLPLRVEDGVDVKA